MKALGRPQQLPVCSAVSESVLKANFPFGECNLSVYFRFSSRCCLRRHIVYQSFFAPWPDEKMAPSSRILITRHGQAEHNVELDYDSKDTSHRCVDLLRTNRYLYSPRCSLNTTWTKTSISLATSGTKAAAGSRSRRHISASTHTPNNSARLASSDRQAWN